MHAKWEGKFGAGRHSIVGVVLVVGLCFTLDAAPASGREFQARPSSTSYLVGERFQILLDLDRPSHIAVVEIDAAGSLGQTHPPAGREPELFGPAKASPLFGPDDVVRQGEPPGRNDYLVIATDSPYTLPASLSRTGVDRDEDRDRAMQGVWFDVHARHSHGASQPRMSRFRIHVRRVDSGRPASSQPEEPGLSGSPSPAPIGRPRLLATIVGVNEYPRWDGAAPLRFAEADARAIRNVLTSRSGASIQLISGSSATKSSVKAAMARLVADSRPGDTVLYFQSGHGVLLADPALPEIERTCLLLADSSSDAPIPTSLTDREIGQALLDALPGRDVVIILDACYSGAGTKGAGELRPKSAPAPYRFRYVRSGSSGRVAVQHGHARLTFLAACTFSQMAFEDDRRGHGLLTAALLEVLPPPTSTGEVASSVLKRVPVWAREKGQVQTPVVLDRSGGSLMLLEGP